MKKMNVLQAPFVEEMVKTKWRKYFVFIKRGGDFTFSKSNTSAPKDSNEI